MGRAFIQFNAFVLGIIVAVALAYSTRGPAANALARTQSSPPLSPPLSPAPIVWSQESSPKNAEPYVELGADQLTYRLQTMPQDVRHAFLVEAVRDGSAASLRNISSRSMSVLPEYRKDILPALKREALSVLLSRFREVDWTSWQLSSFARDGGPTPARSYIDLVFSANPELGRFLETAAQLFHRLYLVTNEAKVFQPQEELAGVLKSAERTPNSLGADRSQGLIPASRLLDAGILQDPTFVITLEQLRSQLIGGYLRSHRDAPLSALALILSAHPHAGSQELSPEFVRLLRQFSLEATPRYREDVFQRLQEASQLDTLAKDDSAVGRALAELYLVGGMDAVESGEQAAAILFIEQSSRYFPGLRAQELLSQLIQVRSNAGSQPAVPQPQVKPAAEQPESSDTSPLLLRKKSSPDIQSSLRTGMSYLSVGIFFLVIVAALFFVFIYWRSVKTLSGPVLPPIVSEPRSAVRMTSPNEMNFGGDEPELERRAVNG